MKKKIIIGILAIFFIVHFLYAVAARQDYSYHIQRLEYVTDTINPGEEKQLGLILHSDHTNQILLHNIGYSDFNVNFVILGADNSWSPTSVYFQGADLLLDISGLGLTKGEYRLSITNNGAGEISFCLDNDGVLNNTQVIAFSRREYFYLCSVVVLLIIGTILMLYRRERGIDHAFFASVIIIGLFLALVIPPYTAPDELRHFARAYDIAQGNIACKTYVEKEEYGSTFPVCTMPIEYYELKEISESSAEVFSSETNYKIVLDIFMDKLFQKESGELREVAIIGSYSISFLAYLPQVIGILIARILGFSPLFVIYMARIGNMIASALIAGTGFRLLPGYKGAYAAVYFSPFISFMRSTNSTDGLLLSLVLLFVAVVLNVKNRREHISKKESILLLVICLWISVIKLPYILIALSALILLEADEIKIKKDLLRSGTVLLTFGIIVASLVFYKINNIITMQYVVGATSASDGLIAHITFVMFHPLRFIRVFGSELIAKFPLYLEGGFSFPNASSFALPSILLLIWIAVGNQRKPILSKREKNAFIYLAAFIWLAIVSVFYLVGPSDVGEIWGIQGRYLHPLLFFALMGINYEDSKLEEIGTVTAVDYSMVIMLGYIYFTIENYWL